MAHRDCLLICASEILLLTYLLNYNTSTHVFLYSDVVESTKSKSESSGSESVSFASESESLKIWTQVRLEYSVGLENYIIVFIQPVGQIS